jgi:hypothetical protein
MTVVECGLCGIAEPFPLVVGYESPYALERGLPANHHQCCVIHVLEGGAARCLACVEARAAGRKRRRR